MSAHVCGCDPEAHHACDRFPECPFGRASVAEMQAKYAEKGLDPRVEPLAIAVMLGETAAGTLLEAWKLTHGDRKTSYGQVEQAFSRYAKIWSGLLAAKLREDLTASDVALLMAGLKLAREMNKQQSDNVTDAHGYLILHDEIKARVCRRSVLGRRQARRGRAQTPDHRADAAHRPQSPMNNVVIEGTLPATWIPEAEVYEQILASPAEESRYGACGGVPPKRNRGSIWWWVYVANELRPIRCR